MTRYNNPTWNIKRLIMMISIIICSIISFYFTFKITSGERYNIGYWIFYIYVIICIPFFSFIHQLKPKYAIVSNNDMVLVSQWGKKCIPKESMLYFDKTKYNGYRIIFQEGSKKKLIILDHYHLEDQKKIISHFNLKEKPFKFIMPF